MNVPHNIYLHGQLELILELSENGFGGSENVSGSEGVSDKIFLVFRNRAVEMRRKFRSEIVRNVIGKRSDWKIKFRRLVEKF